MSYTIMVIDDEQMILDMLRDQFDYSAGHQYAGDGWP